MILLIFTASSGAQTPFEFAIVQDLIQGEPFISVLRINIEGNVLELSVRGGMVPSTDIHRISHGETIADGFTVMGLTSYDLFLPADKLYRVFQVFSSSRRRFSMTSINLLELDVLAIDELSWLSLEIPVFLMDSLLDGSLEREEFWNRIDIGPVDIATWNTLLRVGPYDAATLFEPVDPLAQVPDTIVEEFSKSYPIRSLLLPGWGQISSGRPSGWGSIIIEIAGIGLIVRGYENEGIAALGVNHLVSFLDMFGGGHH